MSRPVAPPPPPSLQQYLEDLSHPNSSSSHASVHVAAFAGASDELAGSAIAGTVATGDRGRQHFSGPHTGSSTRQGVASVASVADLTLQSACRCPHLDAILPHILRMDRYDPIVEMHLGVHFGDVAPLTAGGKLVGSASASASASAPRANTSASAAAATAASLVGSPRGGAAVDAIRHSPNANHHHHQHQHSPTKTTGSQSPAARTTAIGSGLAGPSSPMSPAPTSSGRSSSQQRADRSVFGPEHARLLAVTGRGGAAPYWCPVLPPLYQPSGSVGSKYSSANTSGSSNGANNDKGTSSNKKRKGTSPVSAASPAAKAHSVQVSKGGAATAVSALTAKDAKSNISPVAKVETASAAGSAPKTAGTISPTKGELVETKASVSSPTASASSTTNTNTQAKADGKDRSEEANAVPPATSKEKEEIGAQTTAAAKVEDKIDATAVPPITKEIEIKNETKPGNAEVTFNANEAQVTGHDNEPSNPSNVSAVAGTNKDGDPTDNANRIVSESDGDKKDEPEKKKADTGNVTGDAISSEVESPRAGSHQSRGADQMDVGSPLGKKLSNEKSDIVKPMDNGNEGEKNAGVSPSPSVAKSSTSEVAQISKSHHLPDPRYNQLRSRERRIMRERENVVLKSRTLPPQDDVRLAQQNQSHRPTKRKKGGTVSEGAHEGHSSYERRMLRLRASVASSKVEEWLQVIRDGREAFYNERESNQCQRRCAWCPPSVLNCNGDGLMQCLECSVVGCGPSSTSPDSSVHMMCHFIASGHNFGTFQLFPSFARTTYVSQPRNHAMYLIK